MDWRLGVLLLAGVSHVASFKEIQVQVNTKRSLHVVSERFLSFTVDPADLYAITPLSSSTLNMVQALTPMFLRVGGPTTSSLHFGSSSSPTNFSISEGDWVSLNKMAAALGVDLVVSLNMADRKLGVWDSSETLRLLAVTEQHGFRPSFQIGHSLDDVGEVSGAVLGRDAGLVRGAVGAMPLLAPDLPLSFRSSQFAAQFLRAAGNSISAIPLVMKSRRDDGWMKNIRPELEYLLSGNVPSRPLVDKPLWLVEKERSGGDLEEGLTWLSRMGAAARAGFQVVLRNPSTELLVRPSPDYWLMALTKALVGREVLEVKAQTSPNLKIFCHCTSASGSPILAYNYEPGAVTFFGVNTGPEYVRLDLRLQGLREEPIHAYVLTAEDSTYINGDEMVSAESRVKPRAGLSVVTIPPMSGFFLVAPEAKARGCLAAAAAQGSALVPLAAPRPPQPLRYVTYNEEGWLSKLPVSGALEDERYALLAEAVQGRRGQGSAERTRRQAEVSRETRIAELLSAILSRLRESRALERLRVTCTVPGESEEKSEERSPPARKRRSLEEVVEVPVDQQVLETGVGDRSLSPLSGLRSAEAGRSLPPLPGLPPLPPAVAEALQSLRDRIQEATERLRNLNVRSTREVPAEEDSRVRNRRWEDEVVYPGEGLDVSSEAAARLLHTQDLEDSYLSIGDLLHILNSWANKDEEVMRKKRGLSNEIFEVPYDAVGERTTAEEPPRTSDESQEAEKMEEEIDEVEWLRGAERMCPPLPKKVPKEMKDRPFVFSVLLGKFKELLTFIGGLYNNQP